jgi:hypothetical protein
MINFTGIQAARTYKQINNGRPEVVFPLLCPVREKDWIEGWDYKMIFSVSGLIEKGCVFSTPHHGNEQTIWYVTEHDKENFKVEFVRVTPNEEVVHISIFLTDRGNGTTVSTITYEYTALCEAKNRWILEKLDSEFEKNMEEWENAINFYLETGTMLTKQL